ncbi:polysaccharide biosynthesis/export family protein [Maribacter sp. 2308TA10-17]|uniref:polysaccharide biosynthesis/export family protein n=1 Tax=Maribacter sp. 2308TA10-17 TaxID=3386276 RepID=UPI0039BD6AF4
MNSKRRSRYFFRLKIFKISFAVIATSLFLVSCGNTKNAVYFNNPTSLAINNEIADLEPVIQSNDLLSIVVSSVNAEAADLFNLSRNNSDQSSLNSGNTFKVSGYLVDQDGFINFPILGKIKASGISKKTLRDEITSRLVSEKLLLDPIVEIRYLNYKVSILGEVKNPSVLNVPSEKISLLEALGMAGDITIYGRRDNVTLIREENGVRRIRKIDLTSNEIFSSRYYYLQSNDIVYVQPNKAKVASSTGTKEWIPVVLSAISLAIIIAINVK